MGKYKEQPRYNVVSIRLSDAEKALLEQASREERTTVPILLRAALRNHIPSLAARPKRG